MRKKKKLLAVLFIPSIMLVFLPLNRAYGTERGDVVINEIAWMGTAGGGGGDEWIELFNNTGYPVCLDNWSIEDESYGSANQFITGISGIIPAKGYFLIEKDDDCIRNIPADFISPIMDLNDKGEKLTLKNGNKRVIDVVGRIRKPWYAGVKKKPCYSMERTDPACSGRARDNWHTNKGAVINGIDKKEKSINGTPGAKNSRVPGIKKELVSMRILNSMIPPLVIDYSVPSGAFASIRIYGRDKLVRTLLNEESGMADREPAKEGVQGSCVWDERDSYGGMVEPGEYRALLEVFAKDSGKKEFLFSEPIKIKYISFK